MPAAPPRVLLRAIGANVARLRARLGMTQAQLAEAAGVEPNYLQRIEYGAVSPSLGVLASIAEGLRTEAWRLLRPSRAANPGRKPGRPRRRSRTAAS